MKTATPTVTLFLRIPVPLRERIEAKLKARHADGAYKATLQSVSIEAIERGLALVGENPAQLKLPATPASVKPASYTLPSRAAADLAKLHAAKVSGGRKSASKPSSPARKASKPAKRVGK